MVGKGWGVIVIAQISQHPSLSFYGVLVTLWALAWSSLLWLKDGASGPSLNCSRHEIYDKAEESQDRRAGR